MAPHLRERSSSRIQLLEHFIAGVGRGRIAKARHGGRAVRGRVSCPASRIARGLPGREVQIDKRSEGLYPDRMHGRVEYIDVSRERLAPRKIQIRSKRR
jgi:hypothetical protein